MTTARRQFTAKVALEAVRGARSVNELAGLHRVHRAEIAAFVERVTSGGPPLIPFDQIVNVTRASFAAVTSAKEGSVIRL